MPSPKIRFYSPQELETFAEVFLDKYHKPPESLPVEIDTIAEADLKIGVIPFSSLEFLSGLHGYLALSLKRIYIDQRIMDEDIYERRYRFTVAEEIAHLLLHKELFSEVETPKDYFDVLDKISEREHARMDIDAKRLAEAILMPAELFRKKCINAATNLKGKTPVTKGMLFKKMANLFAVSEIAVDYRYWHLGLRGQIEIR